MKTFSSQHVKPNAHKPKLAYSSPWESTLMLSRPVCTSTSSHVGTIQCMIYCTWHTGLFDYYSNSHLQLVLLPPHQQIHSLLPMLNIVFHHLQVETSEFTLRQLMDHKSTQSPRNLGITLVIHPQNVALLGLHQVSVLLNCLPLHLIG